MKLKQIPWQDQPTPSAPSGQTAAEAAAVLGRCYGTC